MAQFRVNDVIVWPANQIELQIAAIKDVDGRQFYEVVWLSSDFIDESLYPTSFIDGEFIRFSDPINDMIEEVG